MNDSLNAALVGRLMSGSRYVCSWPITSIPGLIERAAIKGNGTTLRNREDGRLCAVAQDRRPSQLHRLQRVAGCRIIAPRQTNSAHLHRPWRATLRQSTLPPPRSTVSPIPRAKATPGSIGGLSHPRPLRENCSAAPSSFGVMKFPAALQKIGSDTGWWRKSEIAACDHGCAPAVFF
jgi:hypothetical protein